MKFLASRRWRIFLTAWVLYSLHFATNIVREHYPAFSLVDHGTFRVDEYQGFHADIFVHRDGHSVIGNQVLVSALAAVPLFVFDPVLDALEARSKAALAVHGVPEGEYRIDKPTYQRFFKLVKERGLDLRFGGAAVVTTVFFMAPLTAAFLVYFYGVLRSRGVAPGPSTELTLLLAFGSPFFYRATVLGHNMFVMFAMFLSFVLLWDRSDAPGPLSTGRRMAAGFFAGVTIATDYMGVLIIPLLYGYLLLTRRRTASWGVSFRESLAMVAGSLPPIAFLLYTQWAMYGNALTPGQYWMPNQNEYVTVGARGWTFFDPDLFVENLFHPGFGLLVWFPLALLALVPVWRSGLDSRVLPQGERRFVAICVVALLAFCSANQYARLQFNSGFRYLLPLVPFLVLAATDLWVRLPVRARVAIAAVAVVQSWVLTVFREPALKAWGLFLAEGPQLPWYRVMTLTGNTENPWLGTTWVPAVLLAATLGVILAMWRYGTRLEARNAVSN